MIVFGPEDQREPSARRIFRATPAETPAATQPRHDALARLLVAANEAERAQHDLASAKARYQARPGPENMQQLLDVAARALEKECVFDDLWEEVSKGWFGEAPPVV